MQHVGLSGWTWRAGWHLLNSGCHHSQNARPKWNAGKRNKEKCYTCIFTLILVVLSHWLPPPWEECPGWSRGRAHFLSGAGTVLCLGFRMGTVLSSSHLIGIWKVGRWFCKTNCHGRRSGQPTPQECALSKVLISETIAHRKLGSWTAVLATAVCFGEKSNFKCWPKMEL